MNRWLNRSTEAAISAFQRCGLLALIRRVFMESSYSGSLAVPVVRLYLFGYPTKLCAERAIVLGWPPAVV